MSVLTREAIVDRLGQLQEAHRTAARSVEQLFGAISQCNQFITVLDEQTAQEMRASIEGPQTSLQLVEQEDDDNA